MLPSPQIKGVAYELAVNAHKEANPRHNHAIVAGIDARECHLLQIYVKSMLESRVRLNQQLAALHAGRMLHSKDGTSPPWITSRSSFRIASS